MAEAAGTLAGATDAVPAVSSTTLTVAGLQLDIYGLSELPATATSVSCLWLHHGRLKKKEDMAETAHRAVSAHHHNQRISHHRGLIAVAFDQRNHGTRLVSARANDSWKRGNGTHAQDMFGMVSGTVSDTMHLIDVLEGYLFEAGDGPGALPGGGGGTRYIDQHLVLGRSLGGHSAWQLLFADPRVTAAVVVIGCPDYMHLLKDRARKSKLATYSSSEKGASFIGSKDFPEALVKACQKYDPKGILFGTGEVASVPTPVAEQERIRPILDSKVRGKRFQILSGGDDKLVPYAIGAPFLDFFKDATATWYRDGNVYVEDNVYAGVGHDFDLTMKKDAVRFILDTVALADEGSKAASAKI